MTEHRVVLIISCFGVSSVNRSLCNFDVSQPGMARVSWEFDRPGPPAPSAASGPADLDL